MRRAGKCRASIITASLGVARSPVNVCCPTLAITWIRFAAASPGVGAKAIARPSATRVKRLSCAILLRIHGTQTASPQSPDRAPPAACRFQGTPAIPRRRTDTDVEQYVGRRGSWSRHTISRSVAGVAFGFRLEFRAVVVSKTSLSATPRPAVKPGRHWAAKSGAGAAPFPRN